ncbi:uncharacterized protein LACBIDRAFT_307350 [Laccaria bicolor S238N-H82]|uniref:Predicted protein n=1 Tax=Laccaria bicolor (strain S238N-H82 / ATCC MYA-4686) TaxID=486041 RepID=B0DPX2_LACBS|nr:uncharacterized protein LACBIDRAFT_307350 [Laccaria bicolor S238N-H82]EDR03190.1 predicted protein [Laccaria bicolor S238N-H82]|eukprot:XP_001885986.1 predicted protein [Laccaria bicolor S238N-H82]
MQPIYCNAISSASYTFTQRPHTAFYYIQALSVAIPHHLNIQFQNLCIFFFLFIIASNFLIYISLHCIVARQLMTFPFTKV